MIWRVAGVDIQPEIHLAFWQVMEVASGDLVGRWLIGQDRLSLAGRISTPIQSFDPDKMTAITRSGRCYHLIGPPRSFYYADKIWQETLEDYGIPPEWQRNVTAEYYPTGPPDPKPIPGRTVGIMAEYAETHWVTPATPTEELMDATPAGRDEDTGP